MPQRNPTAGENVKQSSRSVGLPPRTFLYTLDQISTLIDVTLHTLRRDYVYYEDRSTGIPHKDLIRARNIAPTGLPPDWRVAENELVRWMRHKGFRYYDRASVRG
jgi:hypothetical protein